VVLVGKTATSEFGLLPTVETDLHPPARNPWNPAFLSGGSSGGAATAVAAGMLPLAQGSDGGGSIRIPAALCHLFGFKCSRGFTPDFFGKLDPFGLAVIGALTHTVDDAAAMLDVLCGRPESEQPGSVLAQSRAAPPSGLRIKLLLDSPVATVEPDIREGTLRIAGLLESLGHHVEPIAAPASSLDEFLPIYQRFAAGLPVLHEGWLQPVTRWLREVGAQIDPALAQERVAYFERLLAGLLGDADLMLSPTTPCFAPRVGQYASLSGEEHFRQAAVLGGFTAAVNCSGQPAATVPAGLGGPDRLPFGVQLTGHRGQDARVLQVCRQLERSLEWTHRRAPVVQN
jgi:amidase